MILIDLPYFNEPGFGQAKATNPSSIAYNKNISVQTTRWAIVDWLHDKHQDSIWTDVIASHFTIREDKIRKSILAWAKDEPRIRKLTASAAYQGEDYLDDLPDDTDDELFDALGSSAHMVPPPYSRRGGRAASSAASASRDLLEEFHQGIKTIAAWKSAQE